MNPSKYRNIVFSMATSGLLLVGLFLFLNATSQVAHAAPGDLFVTPTGSGTTQRSCTRNLQTSHTFPRACYGRPYPHSSLVGLGFSRPRRHRYRRRAAGGDQKVSRIAITFESPILSVQQRLHLTAFGVGILRLFEKFRAMISLPSPRIGDR